MPKRFPWKKLSSREVYKNPWIEVIEDKIIHPDKKGGIYGYIKVPTWLGTLPLDENNNVYLVGQMRYAVKDYSWEIPMGTLDNGEKDLDGAKRELREETGITASEWINLGYMWPDPGLLDTKARLYLARDLSFGKRDLEGSEELELKKISFDDAFEWIIEGKIRESASIACIVKAKRYLET